MNLKKTKVRANSPGARIRDDVSPTKGGGRRDVAGEKPILAWWGRKDKN